jgi:chromosome segregation ATPase
MNTPSKILIFIVLAIGVVGVAFTAQLYLLCKEQRGELDTLSDKQKVDSQISNNKFTYQQDQIGHLTKDLENARQEIKAQQDTLDQQSTDLSSQKQALLEEIEKRQQMANANRDILISLGKTKAEVQAIQRDMKGWQKDYVSVLSQLEKKTEESQDEIKAFEDNLTALNIPELKQMIDTLKYEVEKMTPPPDNTSVETAPSGTAAAPKKTEHFEYHS